MTDQSDFDKFKTAVTTELSHTEFYGGADENDDAAPERDS
jgi:hypothetical protein